MEASDIFKKRFRDLIAARGVTYPEIAAACGIMAVAEVVEGKTTAALALAGAYSVLCLAAWLLT